MNRACTRRKEVRALHPNMRSSIALLYTLGSNASARGAGQELSGVQRDTTRLPPFTARELPPGTGVEATEACVRVWGRTRGLEELHEGGGGRVRCEGDGAAGGRGRRPVQRGDPSTGGSPEGRAAAACGSVGPAGLLREVLECAGAGGMQLEYVVAVPWREGKLSGVHAGVFSLSLPSPSLYSVFDCDTIFLFEE
ncbi:hypothetical protein DFH11DRAFT_1547171 [Phellopilus nigrolimitatus]|nr:hypothetical protein DFH11DRAFT_1547171 [Phellopilus nigrolimitatus]